MNEQFYGKEKIKHQDMHGIICMQNLHEGKIDKCIYGDRFSHDNHLISLIKEK